MGIFSFRKKQSVQLKHVVEKHIFVNKDNEGKDLYEYHYYDSENKLITVVLRHVYTDKAGNKYYSFVNPLQMTMERNVASSVANKEFLYNMTVEDLNKICDDIMIANNARDYNTVALKANEIKVRSQKLVEYETTLKLGAIYFLMNDEHPGRYNPLITNKKVETWKADDEARGFFLQLVWDTVKPYIELSSRDLLDYLTADQSNPNRIQKQVGQTTTPKPNQQKQSSGRYNTLT